MTENERVRTLRKAKELTLEKFGERLGVGKTAISKIESGDRNVTDQMRRSICREFGVREEWLRDGDEPMEDAAPADELHRVLAEYGFPPDIYSFLSEFISLPERDRDAVLRYVRAVASRLSSVSDENIPTDADLELARQILEDKRAEDASSVSSGAAGEKKEA